MPTRERGRERERGEGGRERSLVYKSDPSRVSGHPIHVIEQVYTDAAPRSILLLAHTHTQHIYMLFI